MATLNISYFGSVIDYLAGDAISDEAVTTSVANATSGVVPAGTRAIKFNSDTAHHVKIGTGTPDATVVAGRNYIAPNEAFWLHIPPAPTGVALKIAAIT